MKGCSCEELQQLVTKVTQQEKTISQLIGIVSAMNGRLSDLMMKQNNKITQP